MACLGPLGVLIYIRVSLGVCPLRVLAFFARKGLCSKLAVAQNLLVLFL